MGRDINKDLQIAGGIAPVNKIANVDYYYGVWDTIDDAKNKVPTSLREVGRLFAVYTDTTKQSIKLYQWSKTATDTWVEASVGATPEEYVTRTGDDQEITSFKTFTKGIEVGEGGIAYVNSDDVTFQVVDGIWTAFSETGEVSLGKTIVIKDVEKDSSLSLYSTGVIGSSLSVAFPKSGTVAMVNDLITSWSTTASNTKFPSEKLVKDVIDELTTGVNTNKQNITNLTTSNSNKVDKTTSTAQSVASPITFSNASVSLTGLADSTTFTKVLVRNSDNSVKTADTVEINASDGTATKFVSESELNTAYPNAVENFLLSCPNINTTSSPNGVVYIKTTGGWRAFKMISVVDV